MKPNFIHPGWPIQQYITLNTKKNRFVSQNREL